MPIHYRFSLRQRNGDETMNGIIYLIGLIVVIMAILSFFGLR
jgi:predicted membrane channel-forming protein YqfA (hemolysin III family)